jgi:hypothetical protein
MAMAAAAASNAATNALKSGQQLISSTTQLLGLGGWQKARRTGAFGAFETRGLLPLSGASR